MTLEPTVQPVIQSCEVPRTKAQACPVCGGVLVPLRGQWRCSRCQFSLCVGCEVGLGQESADDD